MSFWSAAVLIVLIVVVAKYFQGRGSRELPPSEGHSERERELEHEVEQLRERVKVLERIATDPSRRTAEEIEKLRDE
ncbi:hypothetical protein [Aurantiacibacter hainanensis]|uniref:hypothetical protein n=1 Tax=Aurantiacibacter hainanensis TaxID=3076114 RepID=UPI0030C6881B